MNKYKREEIECTIKSKNYIWFENGNYNLNIIAIRTTDKDNKVSNIFDDYITLTFKVNGNWKFFQWEATTDPGNKAMIKFSNPNGVAKLIPGQYKSTYEVRKHQSKYEALCQKYGKIVKVWRDKTKDYIFDYGKEHTDAAGINIHKSGLNSSLVENWSEGCIVFKKEKDFNEFMKYVNISKGMYGNSFTLTLIKSSDIK